jgi:hypothetical protein
MARVFDDRPQLAAEEPPAVREGDVAAASERGGDVADCPGKNAIAVGDRRRGVEVTEP